MLWRIRGPWDVAGRGKGGGLVIGGGGGGGKGSGPAHGGKQVPTYTIGAAAYNGGGSHQTVMPAHQTGDLLLLHLQNESTNAVTWPDGWTGYASRGQGTTNANWLFYKIATSNAEAAPLVTCPAANTGTRIWAIRGANAADFDGSSAPQGANVSQVDGNCPFAGITVEEAKALVIVFGGNTNWYAVGGDRPSASGWTRQYGDNLGATNAIAIWGFTKEDPPIGALAGGNIFISNSGQTVQHTVHIRPA